MSVPEPAERVTIESLLEYRDWVRALARSLYLDRNRADDVEQETWRIALERPPRHANALRAWFANAVRFAASSEGRSERARSARDSAVRPREPSRSPEDTVAAAELQTLLARAVLELEEPYRTAVLLRWYEGLEASEIAALLGVPVETVRTRLKRALAQLRERMDVHVRDDRDAMALLVLGMRRDEGSTTAAAGSIAAAAGGLAMAAAAKLVAACVILVAGAAWWMWPREDVATAPPRETASASPTIGAKPTPSPRAPRERTSDEESDTAAKPEPSALADGRRIAGRVLAADGRTPVAGAVLRTCPGGPSTTGMALNASAERGVSDEAGVFTLERVPPSPRDPYVLFALTKAGIGWASLPATAGRADVDGVEIVLRAAASVVVTVLDEAGTPQAGARVVALPHFEPLGRPRYWDPDHESGLAPGTDVDAIFGATTDAAGVARFASLPTGDDCGRYDFVAHGKATGWKDGVAVDPSRDTEVTIVVKTLPVRGVVAGVRIVDPDGAPIEGARVVVRSGPAGAEATSGADGVAVLRREQGAVRDGVWGWFDVKKEGFASRMVGVRLAPDDGTPLETVTLQRPAPVEGRITDQHGVPVAGCYVDLVREDEQLTSQKTGDDGSFSFPDATAGAWTLRHHPPPPFDVWKYGETSSPVQGGDRKLAIVLHRLAVGKTRLVVTIVDGDSGDPLSADEAHLIPKVRGDEASRLADTAKDIGVGTVTFERMRPGRFAVWVRIPGRGAFVTDVEIAEGQTEVTAKIVASRPGTLRGRLDFVGAEPGRVRWVSIARPDEWCTPQWGGYRNGRMTGGEMVAADGTFVFEKLTAGRYRLWAEEDGWLGEAFADVPAGGEITAAVRFVRGGVVSFQLAAPSPSNRLEYEISEGAGPWRVVMNISGVIGKSFREEQTLRPGRCRWRVKFPADGRGTRVAAETQEGEVVVVAGETVVVDVPVLVK